MTNTMRSMILSIVCVLLVLLVATEVRAIGYTFDTGNEGFTTCNLDEQNVAYPSREWVPTSWNPAGHIFASATSSMNDRPYFVGQANIPNALGDLTGMTLQADFLEEGSDFTVIRSGASAVAVWSIADSAESGGTWYISNESFLINDLTSWTTKQVELTASNFSPWPWAANGKTFDALLADYSYVGITILSDEFWDHTGGYDAWVQVGGINRTADLGAYSSGQTSVLNIDNFRAGSAEPIPEPLTMASLGLCVAALGGYIRRMRRA